MSGVRSGVIGKIHWKFIGLCFHTERSKGMTHERRRSNDGERAQATRECGRDGQ
jgi:hypothetical protein